MNVETKTAVTVAEMARMCGLSRARFYQLIGSCFPYPLYDVSTRRPFFDEDLQKICLEVRRRNCGVDGKPILFYARQFGTPISRIRSARSKKTGVQADLIEGLKGLGLSSVTEQQVEVALTKVYPTGRDGVSDTELLRRLFLSIKRQNSGDNLGR
jgi:hypothetical protein